MVKPANLPRSQAFAGSLSKNSTTDSVLSGKDGSDYSHSSDSETESNSSFDSPKESNQSSDSTTSSILSVIIRVLSDSILRTEFSEMEMIKAREAARWEAEKRRLEMEMELSQMVVQTYMQAMASSVVGEKKTRPARRKRKRSENGQHESSTTRENSLAFLRLLQLNLIFWNSLT